MRLTQQELQGITGRERPHAQAKWFRDHYGIDLPRDERGPIMTKDTFDKLVEQRAGISAGPASKPRPRVHRRTA